MNNNKLHYYLPHGLKVREKYVDWDSWNISPFIYKQLEKLDSDASYQLQPLLYPLSCLTETIVHEGKEEIPLVELAKIEESYKGKEYSISKDSLIWIDDLRNIYSFRYSDTYKSFFKVINGMTYTAINQILLFEYCYSRRINIWNIDAIDPRELGDNPYKI